MNKKLSAIILIVILIWFYYSELNNFKVRHKDKEFNVHRKYKDAKHAAAMLYEVNNRVMLLKQYMKNKYSCLKCEFYIGDFDMRERLGQLVENYDYRNIYEISPNNIMGSTSFTESKGRKIVFCLRNKAGELHDINTIMFVVLHEITHIMSDRWGHDEYFWDLFEMVLRDAVNAGIYEARDYSADPVKYCGIEIKHNPLFG